MNDKIQERTLKWYSFAPSPDKLAEFLGSELYATSGASAAATGAAPRRLVLQLNAEAGESEAHLAWTSLSSKLLQGPSESGAWCSLLGVGAQQMIVLLQAELALCARQRIGAVAPRTLEQEEQRQLARCTPEHEDRTRHALEDMQRVLDFAQQGSDAYRDSPRRTMPKEVERLVRELVDLSFPMPEANRATHRPVLVSGEVHKQKMNWLQKLQVSFPGDHTLQVFTYSSHLCLTHAHRVKDSTSLTSTKN